MFYLYNTMRYFGVLLVTVLSSYVVFTFASCLGPTAGICLETGQIQKVIAHATNISEIKENYYRNESLYSNLPAIVDLSVTQKTDILLRFPEYFSSVPPTVLEDYVYNGTVYKLSESGRRKRQASADYVCPSDNVYDDIQFSFSVEGNLLQMVQVSNQSAQWVLQETCYSDQGNIQDTICVGKQRTIPAIAVNLDDPEAEIGIHNIVVTSCTARTV